jgi:hypothetical protein
MDKKTKQPIDNATMAITQKIEQKERDDAIHGQQYQVTAMILSRTARIRQLGVYKASCQAF